MSVKKYLESAPLYEIVRYHTDANYREDAVQYSGTPRKHPYDPEKILLICTPFNENAVFYEFRLKDIIHADNMANVVTSEGDNMKRVKIWVKKGSFGLKFQAFEVQSETSCS
jgi:hypothetical protein